MNALDMSSLALATTPASQLLMTNFQKFPVFPVREHPSLPFVACADCSDSTESSFRQQLGSVGETARTLALSRDPEGNSCWTCASRGALDVSRLVASIAWRFAPGARIFEAWVLAKFRKPAVSGALKKSSTSWCRRRGRPLCRPRARREESAAGGWHGELPLPWRRLRRPR